MEVMLAALLLAFNGAASQAPTPPRSPTVLFMCPHGAA